MASGVYTLPIPTPGQWNLIQLPPDSVAFMFKNDSVYDFLLKFGGNSAPTFTSSPGGQANAMVNALEYPVIYVQRRGASEYEQRLNSVGAWDGYLWYLAQDNTGGLATTGTISGRTVLNIMAYGPLDPVPPSGQAVTRQVDITSQPRIIQIPMTPFACYTWTDNGTVGTDSQPFPATIATLNPSTDTGCVIYLYSTHITPKTTAGQMTFLIQALVRDFTLPGTILARINIIAGYVGITGNVGQDFAYHPCVPYSIQLFRGGNLPANAGIIEVNLLPQGGGPGFPFFANVQMDSDKLTPGQVRVPGIGQGLNPSQYSNGVPKF